MSSVVHFEIPVDDIGRARNFYAEAFGFELGGMPEYDYTFVTTTPTGEDGRPTEPGAINGGMFKRQAPFTGPVVTISVDDIDAAMDRVERLGATRLLEKQTVGEMGFAAYFVDTEGNTMGLWQNAM